VILKKPIPRFFVNLHRCSPDEYEDVDYSTYIPPAIICMCIYMRCWLLNDFSDCIHIRGFKSCPS
jgi:hypothetical protein